LQAPGELVTGDHTIFAGEVVASHVGPEEARRIHTLSTDHEFGAVEPV